MFRIILLLPIFVFSLAAAGEDKDYVPPINAIKVNGETVPAEDVKKIYEYWVRVYKAAKSDLPKILLDKLAETSRNQAVARTAVRQYLEKNKLTLDAETAKADFEAYKADLAAEGKNFAESLKKMGKTEEEFAKDYASRSGLTRAKAAEVEKDMENVKKSFEKKKESMKLRRASQIRYTYENSQFTRNPTRTKEDAQKQAIFTLDQLKKGAEFAALAKAQSDDALSKEKGGDLDWIAPDFAPKAVADAVYALQKVGDLSEVVESPQGFHIVVLTDMRSEEKEFKAFLKQHIYSLTLSAETKLAKEAKVEEVK